MRSISQGWLKHTLIYDLVEITNNHFQLDHNASISTSTITPSTPEPRLKKKTQVNIHINTLIREWAYERLWIAYRNLFWRLTKCPGGWLHDYLHGCFANAYYQILKALNLKDFISVDDFVLDLMLYNGWLLD